MKLFTNPFDEMSEGIFYACVFCVYVCMCVNMARKRIYLGLQDGSGRIAPPRVNKVVVGHFYTGEVGRKGIRSTLY